MNAQRSESSGSTATIDASATTERTSERELVVRRTVRGTARAAFEAWTDAEIFRRWWVPESCGLTLRSCEMDVRVGGRYRLEFAHGDGTIAFFGIYREVVPSSRLVWTNEEGGEGETITTVRFEEHGRRTSLAVHELYPSKEALDEAVASGATAGMPEQLAQLDALLAGASSDDDGG